MTKLQIASVFISVSLRPCFESGFHCAQLLLTPHRYLGRHKWHNAYVRQMICNIVNSCSRNPNIILR